MLTRNEEQQSRETGEQTRSMSRGLSLGVLIARSALQLILMVIVLMAGLFIAWRLVQTRPEIPSRPVFPTVYTVDTVTAEPGDHQPVITVYGEVVAGRSVDLRSLVGGKVTSVSPKLKSGGAVRKDEPLVEIDRFSYEGALREAQANLVEAEAKLAETAATSRMEEAKLRRLEEQLVLARNDLDRINQLKSRGSATDKQVEDRALIVSQREQAAELSRLTLVANKARSEQLQANIDRLKWKVEQAQQNLDDTVLTAPFDGTVRSASVETGKLVNANDVLVSMYQTSLLEARFVLTDQRFGRIQSDGSKVIGRPVDIVWTVGGERISYKGRIDRIGSDIASSRGGIELYATIENAGNSAAPLRPGAFVEVSVPDRVYASHFRLPETAIYNSGTVYVVVDGKLQARDIAISSWDGGDALVASGIQPGDEVLTTRISEIGEGLNVRRAGEAMPGKRSGGEAGKSPQAVR